MGDNKRGASEMFDPPTVARHRTAQPRRARARAPKAVTHTRPARQARTAGSPPGQREATSERCPHSAPASRGRGAPHQAPRCYTQLRLQQAGGGGKKAASGHKAVTHICQAAKTAANGQPHRGPTSEGADVLLVPDAIQPGRPPKESPRAPQAESGHHRAHIGRPAGGFHGPQAESGHQRAHVGRPAGAFLADPRGDFAGRPNDTQHRRVPAQRPGGGPGVLRISSARPCNAPCAPRGPRTRDP